MPGFDKTGPNNEGPKTGRGLGDCDEVKEENDKDEFMRIDRNGNRYFVKGDSNRPRRGRGGGRR